MDLPNPFARDVRGADNNIECLIIYPSFGVSSLMGIQSSGTDLCFAGTALCHQKSHFVRIELSFQGFRRAQLGIKQRVSGVLPNTIVDFLDLRGYGLLSRIEPGRKAFLNAVRDERAKFL